MAVRMPASWGQLRSLLTKAAYNVDGADPWQALGFAFMEGPCPTENTITTRARAGRLLCGLAHSAHWEPACRDAADRAAQHLAAAADRCMEGLPALLIARKKQKQSLPLHKELGSKAMELLRREAAQGELLLTQWSAILPDLAVGEKGHSAHAGVGYDGRKGRRCNMAGIGGPRSYPMGT